MEDDTAVKLKQWAERMGYQPHTGEDFPDFTKICKGKTKELWEEVINKVKPLSECEHIRKNILLKTLKEKKGMERKGTFHSHCTLSGSLGVQVKRQQELNQLRKQKKEILHEVESREMSIRDISKDLRKKNSQVNLIQTHIKEAQHKSEIMKIKKKDCESFVSLLDELTNIAKSLFPFQTEYSELQKKNAMEALEKCVKVVEEYQTWYRDSTKACTIVDLDEHRSDLEQKKLDLWKTVSAFIGEIPPELLWLTLTMDLMEKNVSDMAGLASSVNLKSDVDAFRLETECGTRPSKALSTMHIKSMAEAAGSVVKTNILNVKLERLLGEIADEMEALLERPDLNATSSALSRDRILEWLRLRCLRIQLETAKQTLLEEVSAYKKKSLDLASCAQRLKEEKAAVSQLDEQIAEVQTCVEQGLVSINNTESKLRNARQGVLEQLENFACNQQSLFSNDVPSSVDLSDTINKNFNTSVNFSEMSFVCSTPAPNSSSRRIGNPLQPSRLEDTAITNDRGMDSISPARNASHSLSEIVGMLRNAVSKESKSFFKLPLALIPKVKQSTSTEEMMSLSVQSPELIAQLTSPTSKQLLQLAQSSTIIHSPQDLMSLFQSLGHLRAGKIIELAGGVQRPPSLCASSRCQKNEDDWRGACESFGGAWSSLVVPEGTVSLHYLKETAPEQDAAIRKQLDDTIASVEDIAERLDECGHNYDAWVKRPIQHILPSSLEVNGMKFNDWKNKYDSFILGQSKD